MDKENKIVFFFKVNNTKFQNKKKLKNQLQKVINRLVQNNNIKSDIFEMAVGLINDDFVSNKSTLRISFK